MRTIGKAGERRAGSGIEKGEVGPLSFSSRSPLIPLVERSYFRSSSVTESLEQDRNYETIMPKDLTDCLLYKMRRLHIDNPTSS